MNLDEVRDRFLLFAETECKGNSELYYQLSKQISGDQDLLNIASFARVGQPIPNIFFASIHYLLLKGEDTELAKYYPSIQKVPMAAIPFSIFRAFCMDNENEIKKIIAGRIVQTNVINRCAYLMPVFSKIIFDENKPTTIIDIGTSAGLTLNFDKYEYWYNDKRVYGESKVVVKCKIIGSKIQKIYPITQPLTKIGLDQNVIDPTSKDEILWLKALIWPDQLERFAAMEEALKLRELREINFIQTTGNIDFEKEILKVVETQNLIIYATHVLYQFSPEQQKEFYEMIERVGQRKDFYFLSVEGIRSLLERNSSKEIVVELLQYKNRQRSETFLAETNGHGNWIKWL